MRIGILGGTFDPPHVGHLLAATDATEQLGLDRVLWIPVAQQPLKVGQAVSLAAHRVAMARAAIRGVPQFEVDTVEVERGGLSFTVDTVRMLRERWRTDSSVALFLLLGTDAAATLPKWREPESLARLCEIVVLVREGAGTSGITSPVGMRAMPTRRVDVSSTEIRARVRAGLSIRGFVPDAVAEYIAAEGLYR